MESNLQENLFNIPKDDDICKKIIVELNITYLVFYNTINKLIISSNHY